MYNAAAHSTPSMKHVATLSKISLFLGTLLVPFTMAAVSATEALMVPDAANVTRGEFLRASIRVLDIELTAGPLEGVYARPVGKSMQPYVRTAEEYDVLGVFGKDLGLSRPITRAEAVRILVQLKQLRPVEAEQTFTDVQKGSATSQVIGIAIRRNWMKPLKRDVFGIGATLTGREAKLLLARASGQSAVQKVKGETMNGVPTIRIELRTKQPAEPPQSELLGAVWQLLNQKYLHQDKIKEKEAAYRAAQAIVESLDDPYTVFMKPVEAQEFENQIGGEVSGIGTQVEFKDSVLTVVAPLSGSPAEKAGVMPGDQIIAVDGASLQGLGFLEMVNKVRGPKGSTALLRIRRDGNEFDIAVVRATIKVPEINISFQGEVAVVKIVQFGQTTERELRGLLEEVQKQNPKGLVLDLRNNPGGLLHAAQIVLSNFLPLGSGVAHIVSRDGDILDLTVDPPTIDPAVRMVVLVNKGSASASEIVAGALQDHKRAVVLGEQTFGKGTVQQILEFRDGSSLKLTIAEWKTPKGRAIDGKGVTPDRVVQASTDRDEQLLQALDLLR